MLRLVSSLGIIVLLQEAGRAGVSVVDRPEPRGKNDSYVGNRAPLLPSPLIKLPIGSIKPQGWLRKQLQLQADGFHGHLGEISRFLQKENNAWLSKEGKGKNGWEGTPSAVQRPPRHTRSPPPEGPRG